LRFINGKKVYGPPVQIPRSIESWNSTNAIESDWSLQELTNSLPPKWLAKLEEKNLTHALAPAWYSKAALRKGKSIKSLEKD